MMGEDLAGGAVISIAVSVIKRWSWVARHPKAAAAILSLLSALAQEVAVGAGGIGEVAVRTLARLAGAIATYEIGGRALR